MLGHRTLGLEDYTSILKKRWWIIAIPAIIFPILAYAASYLVDPQYLSQTLVLVEQQKVPENYVKPVIAEDLTGRLASMREQILSRSRLEPIINRFNLFAGKGATMDDRLDAMRKAIGIKPIESSMARGVPGFYITFTASDARTAQAVCGEITSMFVTENLKARETSAEGTTEFLRRQLADAKRSLDEQDAKLAKFQQEYVGKLPGQEEPNMNMLNSLNTQLDAATQAIARMQQDLSYGQTILAQQARDFQTPETQRVAPQAQQQQLQTLLAQEADLKARYTPDYPDVKAIERTIADLRHEMAQAPPTTPAPIAAAPRNEPASLLQLRAQIRAEELGLAQKKHDQAAIQSQIKLYQDRISSSPMVQEQYKTLTRDYQTAQESYDALLKNMHEATMATDLERQQQGEQFRVMDEPNLPEAPSSPKRPVFAAGGFALGLALGLAIVALLEYRDTALRSERDIWAFTKLPTLATISLMEDVAPASTQTKRKLFGRRDRGATNTPVLNAGA
jgi:polysaccharide chain length determinant protein (PEP-CTERM system associated)